MHWVALRPEPDPLSADAAEAVSPVDPATAWAWWALQFTPLVARVEEALVMEVSSSERLFGGQAALMAQFFRSNGAPSRVKHAWGATSLVAIGRLRCDAGQALPVNPVLPDNLPLHALSAARAHLPTLSRLGLRTWGQVRALPRGGLVRRFGSSLVDALDCAYGQRAEVYPWLTLPDVFDVSAELMASVETATALLFGARRLLAQLQVWLRARQRGVLMLAFFWKLDPRRSSALYCDAHHHGDGWGRLELSTAQPTQDMGHLARLLGEQLAWVHLPAPVLDLRLCSLETQAMAGESASLLPEDVRHGDSLHQLRERLGVRLGSDRVRCVALQSDHRPERMQRWAASGEVAEPGNTGKTSTAIKNIAKYSVSAGAEASICSSVLPRDGELYPTWLLATPLRLGVLQDLPQYLGPLTLLAGPQRIETGWLDGVAALRDYYVARSPAAGLVWVYRERLDAHSPGGGADWYLHGLFA
ncbi:MAG: DNA polymerase Y family protein [Rhodoferax sp.]|nr:DNA polymerase Y family protein [Rhodoferax sp.]